MASSPDRPSRQALRGALAKVVTLGPDEAIGHPEVAPLLDLPMVRARVRAEGEAVAADALVEVLAAMIESGLAPSHRALLTAVLGLEPQFRNISTGRRRTIAGEAFRGGGRPSSPTPSVRFTSRVRSTRSPN